MEVRDARASEGGRALLFDRLTDLRPDEREEETPLRVLSRDELAESLRKELARLLNTRSTTPLEELEKREWTVLDYGLPDYSGWYTRAPTARARLADLVRRAIVAYEPRLLNPTVKVLSQEEAEHTLRVLVEGSLRVGRQLEPISFPLALDAPAKE